MSMKTKLENIFFGTVRKIIDNAVLLFPLKCKYAKFLASSHSYTTQTLSLLLTLIHLPTLSYSYCSASLTFTFALWVIDRKHVAPSLKLSYREHHSKHSSIICFKISAISSAILLNGHHVIHSGEIDESTFEDRCVTHDELLQNHIRNRAWLSATSLTNNQGRHNFIDSPKMLLDRSEH